LFIGGEAARHAVQSSILPRQRFAGRLSHLGIPD
jgi:hypothetical protein